MWVSFINKNKIKADMNMIQNDNQNVDESIITTKLDSHYYLFIGDIIFITSHSYDAVLCLMMCLITCEASVVSGEVAKLRYDIIA